MDIKLGDGQEISFDLSKITVAEYDELLSGKASQERERELLAGVSGIAVEQINSMSLKDYKRFQLGFINKALSPLSESVDPKN